MARKPPSKAASKTSPGARGTPLLEWIAGAVGLVLVLLTVGVIGHEAVFGDDTPPAVTVAQGAVHAVKGGWLVEIEAFNSGGAPASQVTIEGELALPGQPPETAEASFDYVPDHSRRPGGLFFTQDPRGADLKLRAKGYTEP